MIKYVNGDLFEYIQDEYEGITYVPHVVNTENKWASGFVVAVQKHVQDIKTKYSSLCESHKEDSKSLLGYTQFVRGSVDIDSNRFKETIGKGYSKLYICNMFAQVFGGKRPLFYNALATCMDEIAYCIEPVKMDGIPCRIVAPKFGSLRAGGNWDFIEKLIEDSWTRRGISVTIVSYEENKVFKKKKSNKCEQSGCSATNCPLYYYNPANAYYCRTCYNSVDRY